jgi:hypothetical protein
MELISDSYIPMEVFLLVFLIFVLFLVLTFDVLIQSSLQLLVFVVVMMQLSLGINGGNLCTGLYEAMKPFKSFISKLGVVYVVK